MSRDGCDLRLARLRREHAAFVHELFADERVGDRFIDPTALATPQGAHGFAIASPKMTGQHRFVAVRRDGAQPIGLAMVRDAIAHRGHATIGYAVSPAAWRRGLGLQIARLSCAFGFERLDAPEVRATVKPDNAASLGLLAKLGFRLVGGGERPGPCGKPVAVELHALVREAWRAGLGRAR